MPPVVGQPAPDFTLPSTAGPEVTLSSFRGKANALVAFFPAAFTGVCTAELCSFSENLDRFASTETQVLPVSVDNVPSLKEFKAKEKMKVNLLSDFKRQVSRAYGVLDEDKFLSRRSYFLVDKSGMLRWSYVEEHNGLRRPDDELIAEIRKLQ
jgi:peroxiredoxin